MQAVVRRVKTRYWLLVAAIVMAVAINVVAEAKKPPDAGKVTFLKGKAEKSMSLEGPWKRLKRNQSFSVGEYVRTQDDSRMELRFVDGSTVRIAPTSTMHIQDARVDVKKSDRAVTATLVAGKVWAKVSKAAGSENHFEIRTENAVAGVRGTTFRVNAAADKSTTVKVYAGAVAVSNAPFFERKREVSPQQGPIDFKNRQPVKAPFDEVSKEKWEQLCGEWMTVKVAADGTMGKATTFAAAEDVADDPEWVAWNQELDKKTP